VEALAVAAEVDDIETIVEDSMKYVNSEKNISIFRRKIVPE
jgi:hypothetical protein